MIMGMHVPWLTLYQRPIDIEGYSGEAKCLDFLKNIEPQPRRWKSPRMEFRGKKHDAFTSHHDRVLIPRNDVSKFVFIARDGRVLHGRLLRRDV